MSVLQSRAARCLEETFAFGPDTTVAQDTTLGGILDDLGPVLLHPVALPLGSSVAVGEPVIHDPGMRLNANPGAILLAVGSGIGDVEALPLIGEAAAAGFSAIVMKTRGDDLTAARRVAEAAGVALLAIPDDTPWRQVDALLTATISASGKSRDPYAGTGADDLFALANVIALNVGGATIIEDTRGHVIAHSNLPHQEIDEIRSRSILRRQTPEGTTNSAEYSLVFKSPGPQRVEGTGQMNRLAMAIRAETDLLGVIWVLDGYPPLGPNAEAEIEEAARITALYLLRARAHQEPVQWQRRDALAALLDDSSDRIAAERLGIDFDTPMAVIALAQAESLTSLGMQVARTGDLVNLYCQAWHTNACCASVAGIIYALLPAACDTGDRRVRQWCEKVAAVVERATSQPVRVAIGPRATSLEEVAQSRRLTDRVLQALTEEHPANQIASVDDVLGRVILLELADHQSELPTARDPVTRVHAYDAENSTCYGTTLLTYLDTFGDASSAAARLSIHENTLRYRVRRAQQLFELDLDDPDMRLALWLRLRLRELRPQR